MDLFDKKTLAEAADIADELWADSVKEAPAKDGAWWYRHPKAIMCVAFEEGVPKILTVVPGTWNILKDMHGGDHYWAVGPDEHRVGPPRERKEEPKEKGQTWELTLPDEKPASILPRRQLPNPINSEDAQVLITLIQRGRGHATPRQREHERRIAVKFIMEWTKSKFIREMAIGYLVTRPTPKGRPAWFKIGGYQCANCPKKFNTPASVALHNRWEELRAKKKAPSEEGASPEQ